MFDPESRYYGLAERTYQAADGRHIVYVVRRFLPPAEGGQLIHAVEVESADRPDLLAARAIQRSELYWRLADANGVDHPEELTAVVGSRVRVVLPLPVG